MSRHPRRTRIFLYFNSLLRKGLLLHFWLYARGNDPAILRKLFYIFATLFGPFLHGQTLSVLENTTEPVLLSRDFVFYRDDASEMDFAEAVASKKFFTIDADVANFHVTSATIWARGRITARVPGDWYLSADPTQFSLATLYTRHSGGKWSEISTGAFLPPAQRKPRVNHLIYDLHLAPGDTVDVLFRVKEYMPIQLNFRAGTLGFYVEEFHRMDLYNAICYGMMLMMMIYNLYLFFVQHKRVYLYYVVYVAASLAFSAGINGHLMYMPQWLKQLTMMTVPALIPISFGVFGVLFTLDLFGHALSKRLRLVNKIFIALALINVAVSASPFKHFGQLMLQVMGLLLSVVCIGSGIAAWRAKHASAKYYLAGFGAYTLALVYLILSGQNIVPNNMWAVHSLITGSAIESIMLSFAAADKLKYSEREKEKAQEEALHQLEENARIIREQNITLEQKVKERTLELAEKNKEILDSIHYASRIQRTLLPADSYIEKRLAQLKQRGLRAE